MGTVALFSAWDEHGGVLLARITREPDSDYPSGGDGYRYAASFTEDFFAWREIEGLFGWDRRSVEEGLKRNWNPTLEEIPDLGHFPLYTRIRSHGRTGNLLEVSPFPDLGDQKVLAQDITPTPLLLEGAANFFRLFRGETSVRKCEGVGEVLVA